MRGNRYNDRQNAIIIYNRKNHNENIDILNHDNLSDET